MLHKKEYMSLLSSGLFLHALQSLHALHALLLCLHVCSLCSCALHALGLLTTCTVFVTAFAALPSSLPLSATLYAHAGTPPLWDVSTVNKCRSILGDKVCMAHALGRI